MGSITLHPKGFCITFPYDPVVIADLKSYIPGVRWHAPSNAWIAPPSMLYAVMDYAAAFGFDLGLGIQREYDIREARVVDAMRRANARCAAADMELYDYQPRGIAALTRFDRFLLAWDMRTGKTVVTLCAQPDDAPLVIVAPNSALAGWVEDLGRLLPTYTVAHWTRGEWAPPGPGRALIVPWQYVSRTPGVLADNTTLVLDEVHRAKNSRAQRTQGATLLSKRAARVWGLSGTPIKNRPMDLWGVLSALRIQNDVFGTWRGFTDAYDAEQDRWGRWVWGNPRPDVPRRLRYACHRLTFEEAAPHIKRQPPRYIPVDLSSSAARGAAKWEAMSESWADALRRGGALPGEADTARRELAIAKVNAARGLVEDLIEDGAGPVVVFSYHRDPVISLGSQDGWGSIYSGRKDREETRIAFQTGKIDRLACTIGSMQEGANLSRAKSIVCIDLSYDPGDNAQAMARGDNVRAADLPGVYVLIVPGTWDERVLGVLTEKTMMIRGSLEDGTPTAARPAPTRRAHA